MSGITYYLLGAVHFMLLVSFFVCLILPIANHLASIGSHSLVLVYEIPTKADRGKPFEIVASVGIVKPKSVAIAVYRFSCGL